MNLFTNVFLAHYTTIGAKLPEIEPQKQLQPEISKIKEKVGKKIQVPYLKVEIIYMAKGYEVICIDKV